MGGVICDFILSTRSKTGASFLTPRPLLKSLGLGLVRRGAPLWLPWLCPSCTWSLGYSQHTCGPCTRTLRPGAWPGIPRAGTEPHTGHSVPLKSQSSLHRTSRAPQFSMPVGSRGDRTLCSALWWWKEAEGWVRSSAGTLAQSSPLSPSETQLPHLQRKSSRSKEKERGFQRLEIP